MGYWQAAVPACLAALSSQHPMVGFSGKQLLTLAYLQGLCVCFRRTAVTDQQGTHPIAACDRQMQSHCCVPRRHFIELAKATCIFSTTLVLLGCTRTRLCYLGVEHAVNHASTPPRCCCVYPAATCSPWAGVPQLEEQFGSSQLQQRQHRRQP